MRTLTKFLVTVRSDEFEGNSGGRKYGDGIGRYSSSSPPDVPIVEKELIHIIHFNAPDKYCTSLGIYYG